MADSAIAITTLLVTPGVRLNVLRWVVDVPTCLPYLAPAEYEITASATNNRAAGTVVASVADASYVHSNLLIGVARYYWVRPKNQSGSYGDYYPLSGTSGIVGTPVSTGEGSISSVELIPGAVTADKMNILQLAAISADMGTLRVGKIESYDGKFLIDATNKMIDIER